MAMARKTYARTKPKQLAAPATEQASKAAFINDVLDNTIQATTVTSVRNGQGGLVRIEYDDPDGGPGAGQGGAGTRGNINRS